MVRIYLIVSTKQGDNALAMNEPLSKAYYLKEQLREIWTQVSKEQGESVLDDWVKQARESKVAQLAKMAITLLTYRRRPLQNSYPKICSLHYFFVPLWYETNSFFSQFCRCRSRSA